MPAARLALAFVVLCVARIALAGIPAFNTQEIDASLEIGYAVCVADLSGDGKADIIVADKQRVIWVENGSWQLRTITENSTKPDNVSIAPHDIDGDGTLDLALAAGWQPGNTKQPSTLQWLRRGKTLDEPWQLFPIEYSEPTLHRIGWADSPAGAGKVLITVPLTGRGSTAGQNWAEAPIKIHSLRVPQGPTMPKWPTELMSNAFHVAHGFEPTPDGILVASYEGVSLLSPAGVIRIGDGDQSNPSGHRGASEVAEGTLGGGRRYLATIEPWHGNKVVVYVNSIKRQVLDENLRWGHALWCADLDDDGADELIVGIRDPLPGKAERGIRIYRGNAAGDGWEKAEIDPGGVAVEDLAVADLDGDGDPDIVAAGRQTKNVRIYWNQHD